VVLGDSVDPAICGDLDFNDRTRTVSAVLATTDSEQESPFKYWWRRGRHKTTGNTAGLLQVRRDSAPAGQIVETGNMAMPLDPNWDVVGMVLIITNDGGLQVTDSAFLYDRTVYDPELNINYRLQHWRHIEAPVLDSGLVDSTTVTLWWQNRHEGRTIDSTIVFRNGGQRITLGPGATDWQDTGLAVGGYSYQLKHFTPRVMVHGALAFPNSSASSSSFNATVTGFHACAHAEPRGGGSYYTGTYLWADQYLSAGCSSVGGNVRYRWYNAAGGPLTGWTSDTLFDFTGHGSSGSQLVVLKDSNTTTYETAFDTVTFAVSGTAVTLSGPTFISDKTKKLYVATVGGSRHWGQWFERYEGGPQWYAATAGQQDTLVRVWPMGEYNVHLRQHKDSAVVLHRRRLFIEVCSSPDCQGNAPVLGAAAAGVPAGDWGLFGAGPWLSWGGTEGRRALRIYDLWVMHDRETAFGEIGWFDAGAGRFTDAATGWEVAWVPRELGLADVRAFDFAVSGTRGRSYVFGLGLDPDLGPNAADDVASYDAGRGLVLVADGERAVGFLLREGARDALASIQEYGVGRFAPTIGDYAWAAQRTAGTQLMGTRRDVQLVLSAPEATGAGTWRFVVIRGDTAGSVQATADAVLRGLR
jgi:hypothetical protein